MAKSQNRTRRYPIRISLRTTPETRAKLEEAAAKTGRSLSGELELRLERSFSDENLLVQILGGPEAQALALIQAANIRLVAAESEAQGLFMNERNFRLQRRLKDAIELQFPTKDKAKPFS